MQKLTLQNALHYSQKLSELDSDAFIFFNLTRSSCM